VLLQNSNSKTVICSIMLIAHEDLDRNRSTMRNHWHAMRASRTQPAHRPDRRRFTDGKSCCDGRRCMQAIVNECPQSEPAPPQRKERSKEARCRQTTVVDRPRKVVYALHWISDSVATLLHSALQVSPSWSVCSPAAETTDRNTGQMPSLER